MKYTFIIFFLFSSFLSFSQTDNTVIRKIQRFENTQRDLTKITTNNTEIKDSVFQFVETKRLELAPNCPLSILNNVSIENRTSLIENWYIQFPLEYKNYVEFLERLIRSKI